MVLVLGNVNAIFCLAVLISSFSVAATIPKSTTATSSCIIRVHQQLNTTSAPFSKIVISENNDTKQVPILNCCSACASNAHCTASELKKTTSSSSSSGDYVCHLFNVTMPTNTSADGASITIRSTEVTATFLLWDRLSPTPPDDNKGSSSDKKLSTTIVLCILAATSVLLVVRGASQYNSSRRSRTFGKYEVIREIGCGAFSTVYLVHRISDGQPFAMKLLLCKNREDQANCLREFHALLHLRGHENIVQVVDVMANSTKQKLEAVLPGYETVTSVSVPRSVGTGNVNSPSPATAADGIQIEGMDVGDDPHESQPFVGPQDRDKRKSKSHSKHSRPTGALLYVAIVTVFYPDDSLQRLLSNCEARRVRLRPMQILSWSHQIANGLAFMHSRGLLHRDLKPGNCLLTDDTKRVVIGDLGLSRIIDEAIHANSGAKSNRAGTLQYLSPEQSEKRNITGAVDVWALGCIMYAAFSRRAHPSTVRTMFQFVQTDD
eukprot:PhM_4_TR13716/c0_g1_i3/m.91860